MHLIDKFCDWFLSDENFKRFITFAIVTLIGIIVFATVKLVLLLLSL
jgi:hypothetical protein